VAHKKVPDKKKVKKNWPVALKTITKKIKKLKQKLKPSNARGFFPFYFFCILGINLLPLNKYFNVVITDKSLLQSVPEQKGE